MKKLTLLFWLVCVSAFGQVHIFTNFVQLDDIEMWLPGRFDTIHFTDCTVKLDFELYTNWITTREITNHTEWDTSYGIKSTVVRQIGDVISNYFALVIFDRETNRVLLKNTPLDLASPPRRVWTNKDMVELNLRWSTH